MNDYRISETDLFAMYLYRIYVNEVKYDEFFTKTKLSRSERNDVLIGYQDALEHYSKD